MTAKTRLFIALSLAFAMLLGPAAEPAGIADTGSADGRSANDSGQARVVAVARDVEEGDFYFDAVHWGLEQEIFELQGDRFFPSVPAPRGLTAVWMWKMEGRPPAVMHNFNDVNDETQDAAISWMARQSITTGTSSTTFSPRMILNRAQIAAFLHRLNGNPTPAAPHSFLDLPQAWAQDAVSWMSEAGITTGTSSTTYSPDKTLSRAELITFLHRYKGSPAPENQAVADDELTITLPFAPASGRCADHINLGIYNWEECAWAETDNPELKRSEAQQLTEDVWREVTAPGKPTDPPALVEGVCGVDAKACYQPDDHTIVLQTGFDLRTFLHELAHALLGNEPTTEACHKEWERDRQGCYHGDIFRCVADGLFVRFGNTRDAGVCGTGTAGELGEWVFQENTDALSLRTQQSLYVLASGTSIPTGGTFDTATALLIRCFRNQYHVIFVLGDRRNRPPLRMPLTLDYRIGEVRKQVEGARADTNNAVFAVEPEMLMADLLQGTEVVMRAVNENGSAVATATFNISHLNNRLGQLSNCILRI